jgi:hypothetical protein
MMKLFSRNGHILKVMFLHMKAGRLEERQAGRKAGKQAENRHQKQTNKRKIVRQTIRKHAGAQNTG